MNFGKFQELSTELQQVKAREEEILAELRALVLGDAPRIETTSGRGSGKTRKGKAPKKAKGQLQEVVLQVLRASTAPHDLNNLVKRVSKIRPAKRAAVGSVLHSLTRRGVVLSPSPGMFYLPQANKVAVKAEKTKAPAQEPQSLRVLMDEPLES